MSEYIPTVTFAQARTLAMEAAFRKLEFFIESTSIPVIREDYMEAECCWFFFRNPLIVGPPEKNLSWNFAIAISKRGEISIIADFSDEPKRLEEYLKAMSDYFKERGL